MSFAIPDAAFTPFFDATIAFRAVRSDGAHLGSVKACIFDEGYADVYDETSAAASRIGRIVFHVTKMDWAAAISSPPQQGDRFTSPDTGKTYALTSVTHFAADTWSIDAKEVCSL